MDVTSLWLQYPDRAALVHDFEANLKKGRAFVPGPTTLRERDACQVVIEHPASGDAFVLEAEAVWINPNPNNAGAGVQFTGFDQGRREALFAFVNAADAAPEPDVSPEAPSADEHGVNQQGPSSLSEDELGPGSSGAHRNLYDRVRGLSSNERSELARQGGLPERVALERCFGGSVWESLLQNPQLTPREVARLARSGSLPSTLVGSIVANRGWLADPGVQHALLANPRVGGAHLERVLRVLPQAELTRIATHASYRLQVRTAAKRLIVR